MFILSNCENADALDHSLQQFDTGQNADYSDTGNNQIYCRREQSRLFRNQRFKNSPNIIKNEKPAHEKSVDFCRFYICEYCNISLKKKAELKG